MTPAHPLRVRRPQRSPDLRDSPTKSNLVVWITRSDHALKPCMVRVENDFDDGKRVYGTEECFAILVLFCLV